MKIKLEMFIMIIRQWRKKKIGSINECIQMI